MKLTNDQINQAAAELLGEVTETYWWCDSCQAEVPPERVTYTEHHDVPDCGAKLLGIKGPSDFIRDANAVRELVLKVRRPSGPRMVGEALMPFITNRPLSIGRPNLLEFGLIASLKSITLACLVAAGKITLEQAREAMEGDGDE